MLIKKISFCILPIVATLSLNAGNNFINDPFGDDIFKQMMQMQKSMDKMFNRMHSHIQQRNLNHQIPEQGFIDKKDSYEFITNIPKSDKNKIDIDSKNGILSINAKIVEKKESNNTNGYSSSSSVRIYQQNIPMPNDVDNSTIKMSYNKNNLLVISVAKKQNTTKKIKDKKLPKLIDKSSSKN